MNKYLSVKLKVISFLLMIMVVFLHAHNIADKLLSGNTVLDNGYSSFFQDFISDGLNLIAVPLFFAISGYLFFYKLDGTYKEFLSKFNKRLKTLVVPYLFWSIGILLLFFILQFLPESNTFFGNKLIKNYSLNELLIKIFILPIPLQLWFVRDLIVLTILSPVIYWLIRIFKYLLLLIFFITWFLSFDFIILSNEALLFFVFGAFLSIYWKNSLQIDFSKRYFLYISLWIIIVLVKTILLYINFQNNTVISVFHKTGILMGIVAIWSLYDYLFRGKDLSDHKFFTICSFSFFLFAFHIPAMNIFKRGLFLLMGKEEFASLFIYITAPLLTISIGILIGYYMKRFIPKFYFVITGGR